MFIKNESSYCRLYNTPFKTGDVQEVTDQQVEELKKFIERGSFSLHEKDPTKPSAPKKTRSRRKRKPVDE